MKILPSLTIAILFLAGCGDTDSTSPATQATVAATHGDHGDAHSHTDSLDLELYFDGALAQVASDQACTLADGSQSICYAITIAGYPTNHDVGPFCPPTTTASAEEGGIWFDGNAVYDVDGAFILGLAQLYDDSNWKMYDDDGTVHVTDTVEAFNAAARPDVDPAYQNYCVEGRMEWLDNGAPVTSTVMIPNTPVAADSPTPVRGNLGITLNGVIIAAPAPVDAILGAYTIAAFDDCGGHINPFEGYHLHGARGCSEAGEAVAGETPIFGYALDGYPIRSPLTAATEATAALDQCNGHSTADYGYHYHAASAEKNGVLSCFTGLTVQTQGADHDGGGRPGRQQPGGAPDFAAAAAILGVTEQALQNALGAPPPNFAAAAQTLGVTEQALQEAMAAGGGAPRGAPPR